jgi:CDP-diacylglycerol--serine O-phosphatidyltransferase
MKRDTGPRIPGARLKRLPLNSIVPNIFTVLALCAGLISIQLTLREQWHAAVGAVLIAAVLDGLDGRLARLLKGATKFGAELDSLSDFLAFGVAPALLVYRWTLHQLGDVGYIVVLVFAVCCALRLARFNVMIEEPGQPKASGTYFVGVAAPAAGGLAIWPVMCSFELGEGFRQPVLNAVIMLTIAFLMVSRIPTYSLKKINVQRDYILPTLVAAAAGLALTYFYLWWMMMAVGVAYMISIPLGYRVRRQQQQADQAALAAYRAAKARRPALTAVAFSLPRVYGFACDGCHVD